MIVSGGENIYAAVLEHPNVTEAALIGQPDGKLSEVGSIVVPARECTAPTAESVRQICADRLARAKIPTERHVK